MAAEPRQPNSITGQKEQQTSCLPVCSTTQAWQEASGMPPQGHGLPISSTSEDVEFRRVHSDEPASRIAEVSDAIALPGP